MTLCDSVFLADRCNLAFDSIFVVAIAAYSHASRIVGQITVKVVPCPAWLFTVLRPS